MSVTVIIPTTGREALRGAVGSVAAQTFGDLEIVVAADVDVTSPRSGLIRDIAREFGARVLWTGGSRGAGYARAAATESATRPFVAYLDDDDVWVGDKLGVQTDVARSLEGDSFIVASRVRLVTPKGFIVAPKFLYCDGRSVSDYLFVNRRLALDRALLHTSTLFLPATFARQLGWKVGLRRHQDWDFVVRAGRTLQARIVHLPDVLAEVSTSASDSISSSSDWQSSLAWYAEESHDWSPRARVDFLLGQVARYALQARSADGLLGVYRAVRAEPARPSPRVAALALAGLLPRRVWARSGGQPSRAPGRRQVRWRR